MDKDEIQRRIIKVVCQVLKVEPDMVRSDSNFAFDLGAESTQSVELVAGLEAEFDVELNEDAALAVQTVGEAVEFVGKHVKDRE